MGTLLLCVVLGLFEAFTLYVLAKFAERYSASNYSVLVRKALGRKTAASKRAASMLLSHQITCRSLSLQFGCAGLSAIMLLYLWGSCIAYLVIIGDSFSSITSLFTGERVLSLQLPGTLASQGAAASQALQQKRTHHQVPKLRLGSADGVLADRRLLIAGIGLLVVLPMCFPRNLGALAWVSVGAVVGFVFTAVTVVLRSSQVRPAAAGMCMRASQQGWMLCSTCPCIWASQAAQISRCPAHTGSAVQHSMAPWPAQASLGSALSFTQLMRADRCRTTSGALL